MNNMDIKLLLSAISKFVFGFVLVALLVFMSAGTLSYLNGWILIFVMFVPMFLAGLFMFLKNPVLLKRRLTLREKQTEQKFAVIFSAIMFVCGFIVSGICYRYEILIVPVWVSIVFSLVFLTGYILYGIVLCENEYLSRNIEVLDGQKVIDKGLYGIVRHPMYFATVLMFMSIPLILGTLSAGFVFLFYPFIIVFRIRGEEKLLERDLSGYTQYKEKVKYRMIPFIW